MMKRSFLQLLLAALLVSILLVLVPACGGTSTPKRNTSPALTSALSATSSGPVTQVNQPWLCNSAVDVGPVSVTLNSDYTGTTLAAIKTGPNCTGHIILGNLLTFVEDGIKISGSHDLVIEGGIVDCADHIANAHQDGTQVLAGKNITFQGVVFNCHTANNANYYLSPVNGVIDGVVCDGCWLGPTQSSTAYVLDQATNSGIKNSTICPSLYFAYRHNLALNINNAYPTSC